MVVGPRVISDGADKVAFIIAVSLRVTIVVTSEGWATIHALQAEDEVVIGHAVGMPVLPKGCTVQPELRGQCSSEEPAREARARGWVLFP